jgi:iron(III) transport system ATP-binding protein
MNKGPMVEFRAVSKRYGPVTAVNEVSFGIERGTLVTLLGPSGCGKTTTLRLIAGLEMATSGHIFIDGEDVTLKPATERDVSMVFQSYALFPHMTVLDNAAYGLVVSGRKKKDAEEAARAKLALVGLRDLDKRLPSELSGGQQQRVAVARSLVLEPKVLLFDEPLSNLDAKLRRRVRDEIRELQQRLALTVVYVTHDQHEALAVSDRVVVMDNAIIAQQGTPHDLYDRPVTTFVADFIGEANLVKGRLKDKNGERGSVVIGETELTLPHAGLPVGEVEIAIRPESVRLSAQAAAGPRLAGTVVKAAYLGSIMEYTVATAIGELFAVDRAAERQFPKGAQVHVILGPSGVHLVRRSS